MAAAAGLDRAALCRYEAGKVSPSRPTLERLAGAAGVPAASLDTLLLPAVRAADATRGCLLCAREGHRECKGCLVPSLLGAASGVLALLLAGPGPCDRRARPKRRDVKALVAFLCFLRGCTQAEMAAAACLGRRSLCRHEAGEVVRSRATLERLAATAGLPTSLLDAVLLPTIALVRATGTFAPGDPAPDLGAAPLPQALSAGAAETLATLLAAPRGAPANLGRPIGAAALD